MDKKTLLLIAAMLAGKRVRLKKEAYRTHLKMQFNSKAGSWVFLQNLAANGTFQICSQHHEITDGLKPSEFI